MPLPLKLLLPRSTSTQVKAEQIRLLYQQGTLIQSLGIVTGLVALMMFWTVINHTWLLIWISAHLALSIVRLHSTRRFMKSEIPERHIVSKWGPRYVWGTFVSGLLWGSLSLFYDPAWPMPYQVTLFTIFTGMTASVFSANTSYFIAFPTFYVPPVSLLAFTVFSHPSNGFLELGLLVIIYMVLMYISGLQFHNRLTQSLEARFEHEDLAKELAQSNKKLKHIADIDALTGIANRRAMDSYLTKEWNRHSRNGQPLSLLFIDVDYFKQYNDTYGHDAGDRCLTRTAGLLRAHVKRAGEMVARFGGEEFAAILPETDLEHALRVAEAIRIQLEHLQIPHAGSEIADHLTVSIGVACTTPSQTGSIKRLRQTADKALYQAKNAGRNRVIWLPVSEKANAD